MAEYLCCPGKTIPFFLEVNVPLFLTGIQLAGSKQRLIGRMMAKK
jgi:hypothetical protein